MSALAPTVQAWFTEQERHNSARTRNARLAAIRSLYRYAARAIQSTPS